MFASHFSWHYLAIFGQYLAIFWRLLAIFGQYLANFIQFIVIFDQFLANFWSFLANFQSFLFDFDHFLALIGHFWSKFCQFYSIYGHFWLILGYFEVRESDFITRSQRCEGARQTLPHAGGALSDKRARSQCQNVKLQI